jgi:hypothetical protein
MTMKIVVESISKSDLDNKYDIKELEQLVEVVMYCMDSKSIKNTISSVNDRLINDRMDSYYSDELILSIVSIMSKMIIDNTKNIVEYSIDNYTISINELSRLCIILRILVMKELIKEE